MYFSTAPLNFRERETFSTKGKRANLCLINFAFSFLLLFILILDILLILLISLILEILLGTLIM